MPIGCICVLCKSITTGMFARLRTVELLTKLRGSFISVILFSSKFIFSRILRSFILSHIFIISESSSSEMLKYLFNMSGFFLKCSINNSTYGVLLLSFSIFFVFPPSSLRSSDNFFITSLYLSPILVGPILVGPILVGLIYRLIITIIRQ